MRQLAAELPTQEQLNIDETATKEENGKAWLWTFVARMFTVFAVRATREATALGVFLGDKFRGIVTCDRAKMYWQVGRLQWCWAHLKRDFQAMIDGGDSRAKRLGRTLATRHLRVVRALGRLSRRQDFAGGAAASDGTRPPQGGAFAAARHAKRQSKTCAARAGSCTSIASGCGRSCATKGSNRRTMRASGRCVMR